MATSLDIWNRVVELLQGINGPDGGYTYDLTGPDCVKQGRRLEPPAGVIGGDGGTVAYAIIALESIMGNNSEAELGVWRRDLTFEIFAWAPAADDVDDLAARTRAGVALADDIMRAIEADRDLVVDGRRTAIDIQLSAQAFAGDELGLQIGGGLAVIQLTGYFYADTGV